MRAFWHLGVCDCCKILWMFIDPKNSLYIQYFNSELSVETSSLLWCVLMHCFASNIQFFRSNNFLVNSLIAFRIIIFRLGNILMCNLYVFGRILGISSFSFMLVSIDFHVKYAVRHSFKRLILWDINVHLVCNHIAVMSAVRLSLERVNW